MSKLAGRVFHIFRHILPVIFIYLLTYLPLPFPPLTTLFFTLSLTLPLLFTIYYFTTSHFLRNYLLPPISKKFKPSTPLHEWPKSYAMVTGATVGLGYEFAKLLAADGYNLVLVARSEDKLQEVKKELADQYGVNIKVIAKDLSLPNAAWQVFDEVRKESFLVELLINNAGVGVTGPFTTTSLEQNSKLLQLNVVALTELTYLMVKRMLTEGDSRGKVMNLASCAAFVPGPYMATYCASKAYVLSFTEALSYELRDTDISVVAVCPGATATNFTSTAGNGKSGLFTYGPVMSASDVARESYRAWMQGGETVIVPGFHNWITQWLGAVPRFVLLPVVSFLIRDV